MCYYMAQMYFVIFIRTETPSEWFFLWPNCVILPAAFPHLKTVLHLAAPPFHLANGPLRFFFSVFFFLLTYQEWQVPLSWRFCLFFYVFPTCNKIIAYLFNINFWQTKYFFSGKQNHETWIGWLSVKGARMVRKKPTDNHQCCCPLLSDSLIINVAIW